MRKDSIDKILQEALAIEREDAAKADAIGYMVRALVQTTMPHSNVDGYQFERRNGACNLSIVAHPKFGLPYGSIPRLLVAWIATETVRTQSKELVLGNNLSSFMTKLDLIPTGGRWGNIARLKNQMKRLFSCSISFTYEDQNQWAMKNIHLISQANLWWVPKNPQQSNLFDSYITLGDDFFNEILKHPIPVDMRALRALRQSPLALDLYCWLTYRMSYLRKKTTIPWSVLQLQFGSNYKEVRQFKARFLYHLKKVLIVYPDVRVLPHKNGLEIFHSRTHVPVLSQYQGENNFFPSKIKKYDSDSRVRKKYEEYRVNAALKLANGMPNKLERLSLFNEFGDYLSRKGLSHLRTQMNHEEFSNALKEELYYFMNQHWRDVLAPLISFKDFCDNRISL